MEVAIRSKKLFGGALNMSPSSSIIIAIVSRTCIDVGS